MSHYLNSVFEKIEEEIEEARQHVSAKAKRRPEIGIILGTGLGRLAETMSVSVSIPYGEIPHFGRSTVESHPGRLLLGTFGGKEIVAMQGRVHFYEGYSLDQVVFPVRVMKRLGVNILIVSNAAGGLDPLFRPGDVMLVCDHINLTGQNPLIGPNIDSLGIRFPEMSAVYDAELIRMAESSALERKIELRKGVYVGVTGPSLETPAETRFLRMIGADAVGMSTVPEVIAAVHCGLRVLAFSAISNVNLPDCMKPIRMEDVLAGAAAAGEKMIRIVEGVLEEI
ncbi:MAG TPA: purine-nucleoside phosphorylase [Thermodesulfobacteriota bacterium]|nr:purine-nucleoside phosphorylase [Thermodesulfobacteriota bacterium]